MAKSKKIETTEYCCSICGTPLTDENSRENAYTCWECETQRFRQLEEKNGTHMALWGMCGMVDLPLEPLIVPYKLREMEGNRWKIYCDALKEKGKLEKRSGKLRGFADGVTDIREIFGMNIDQKDFAKYVEIEQELQTELEGTEEQRERWGTADLWLDVPMTTEIYDELDRQYENRLASYKGQTITPQMDDTLIKVAKFNTIIDCLMSKGESKTIMDIQKTVDNLLASEQMRKKDEKPVENLKMDTLVVALEKNGLMESGDLLIYDELVKVMRDKFIKNKKYDYSLDSADQMIIDYYNNLRANADMQLVSVLPDDLEVVDEYGEFEEKETEEEKKRKKYAGLTPVQFEKQGGEE